LLNLILLVVTLLLMMPMVVVSVECMMACCKRAEDKKYIRSVDRPRIGVLIPAHNEEAVIANAISCILKQLVDGDQLLVVADNCTDNTVGIASNSNAHVIERVDERYTGKGYALDAGIREFEKDPPEVIIVIDADCEMTEGTIDNLAKKALYLQRPTQAVYLIRSRGKPSSNYEIFGQFAWIVKNWVRPLGLNCLGLPCMLTGSGMAFPWPVIRDADLACGHIAEDLKLGLDLILDRKPPVLCLDAVVTSYFPAENYEQEYQRRRWEHGYLDLGFRYVPRLWFHGIRHLMFQLIAVSFDLMVPPLALLCLLLLLGLTITGAGFMFGYSFPFFILSGMGIVFFLVLLLVRNKFAHDVISISQLLRFPLYVFMKLPLYWDFLVDRETKWRDAHRK